MAKNKFNYSQLSKKKGKGYKFKMDTEPCTDFYLNNAKRYRRLGTEEEQEIIARIKAGDPESDRLMDTLVGSHQSFIIMFAQRHCPNGSDLFMDLIQEGNYGLCVALERFDPSKKVKFISYANAWIVKYMYEFLQNNELIRRSNRVKTWCMDVKLRDEFVRNYGYEPTCEELMLIFNEMGISIKKPEDLQEIKIMPLDGGGQNSCVSDDDDDDVADFEYGEVDDFDDRLDKSEKYDTLRGLMNDILDDEERVVLELRFGFDGMDEYTVKEIAEFVGSTVYKVGLLLKSAIGKLGRYGVLFDAA